MARLPRFFVPDLPIQPIQRCSIGQVIFADEEEKASGLEFVWNSCRIPTADFGRTWGSARKRGLRSNCPAFHVACATHAARVGRCGTALRGE
jgi:hypothetical protein